MNPQDSLNASFWVTIVLQAFGSFDPVPGTGPRKMPSPASFVPVIIAWIVLQLASDAGYERPASAFGWLMVLVSIVLGPFGKRLLALTNYITTSYGGTTSTVSSIVYTPPSNSTNNV